MTTEAHLTDFQQISASQQEQIRLLREECERLRARGGLQDYLRLLAKYHDALDLIAKHERTIANQARDIERLKEERRVWA